MLQIGKEWRIRELDDRNLIVERLETVISHKDKTTRLDWVHKGYHGNLKSAVKKVLRDATKRAVGHEERVALEQLVERIEEAERNIVEAVTALG